MKKVKDFPFHKARRLTASEIERNRLAIEAATGKPRRPRGRPAKDPSDRHRPVSIRLNPKILAWAKREALERGVGYQTVINDTLLYKASRA